MIKFKDSNIITKNSYELILPESLLHTGYLNKIGIVQCGISRLKKGTLISRAANRKYHILIFCLSGEGSFFMEDGSEITLKPRQYFFSNACGQGHKHYPKTEEWELCWFQIQKECKWITNEVSDYECKESSHVNEIRYCMENILSENRWRLTDYILIQELYGQLLHIYLKRELETSKYSEYQLEYLTKFNQMWTNVSHNLDQPWDIAQICNYLSLSRSHVTRLCKLFYKKAPADIVREIRLKYARSLLANLNLSVSAVAELSGYNSISSFSVAYKNYFGETPKETKAFQR